MRKLIVFILYIGLLQNAQAQIKFRYGLTAGLNLSSAILPDLKVNTNINSILQGEDVVKGAPQLADFVALYKAGIFFRLDGGIGSLKLNVNYTRTNIHEDINTDIFNIKALDIDLNYLDFDITYNLNLFKHFYISAGYVPSLLLDHEGNLNINDFDQRLLAGIGFRFANGATIDFNAVAGIVEIIDGSYIHNIMIPITINIPLNK